MPEPTLVTAPLLVAFDQPLPPEYVIELPPDMTYSVISPTFGRVEPIAPRRKKSMRTNLKEAGLILLLSLTAAGVFDLLFLHFAPR